MALALLFVKVARAENYLVSSCRDPPCPDPADDGSIYELALFAQQQCSLGGEKKQSPELGGRASPPLCSAIWGRQTLPVPCLLYSLYHD